MVLSIETESWPFLSFHLGNWATINAKTVSNVVFDENTWNKVFE